jgi:hypothetical protein
MQDQSSELSSLQILRDFRAFTKAHKSATEVRNNTDGLILVQLNHQVSGLRNEKKATNKILCTKIITNRKTYIKIHFL